MKIDNISYKSLQKIAMSLLNKDNLSKYFWAETVNIAYYIMNCVLLGSLTRKTPMSYGMVGSPTSTILMSLVVNVLF